MGTELEAKSSFEMESGTQAEKEVFLSLKRHDDHNLELKSLLHFEQKNIEGSLDLYLFLPPNVQVKSWSKEEITSDFYSRQRLYIPQNASLKTEDLQKQIAVFANYINLIKPYYQSEDALIKQPADDQELILQEIFSQAQSIGAYIGESIKASSIRTRKELLIIHSKIRSPLGLEEDFQDMIKKMDMLKELITSMRAVTDQKEAMDIPVVQLLDEYVHHLYVESLGKIKEEYFKLKKQVAENQIALFQKSWSLFDAKLKDLQKEETFYQVKHRVTLKQVSQQDNGELLIVRLGQMKKFFQSKMFVQVLKKQTMKKLSEPTAALAASFAAISAGIVQHYGNSQVVDYSLGGLSIAFFGMALYVLRDRLKDLGRIYIMTRVSKFLPDMEYNLVADNKKIGKIQEWIKIISSRQIPNNIQLLRKKACVSEAESFLQEDVIHMRRSFSLFEQAAADGNHFALQENLRINLERYLKHLDDPQKEIVLLNKDGQFSKLTSNKVYYFYAIADVRMTKGDVITEQRSEVYRIVMNKLGLLKVKPLSS